MRITKVLRPKIIRDIEVRGQRKADGSFDRVYLINSRPIDCVNSRERQLTAFALVLGVKTRSSQAVGRIASEVDGRRRGWRLARDIYDAPTAIRASGSGIIVIADP